MKASIIVLLFSLAVYLYGYQTALIGVYILTVGLVSVGILEVIIRGLKNYLTSRLIH